MSTYRAGQRVRIEWKNGDAMECLVADRPFEGLQAILTGPTTAYWMPLEVVDGRTVTILSEPRPEEPTGRGAVVEAATDPHDLRPRQWIHMGFGDWLTVMDDAREPGGFWTRRERWSDLIDPVVLHEGMTP